MVKQRKEVRLGCSKTNVVRLWEKLRENQPVSKELLGGFKA